MILFSKTINSIHSLNFLSPQQRAYYKRDLNNFHNFIDGLGLYYSYHSVHSSHEAEEALSRIPVSKKDGLLINFIGHGNLDGIADNAGFFISWNDLVGVFQNLNSSDNLIINTSLMCKGHGIFRLSTTRPKAYFAAFGTNTSTDAQTYYSTQVILTNCLNADNIERAIASENKNLRNNAEGFEGLDARAQAHGIIPNNIEVTQFSCVVS